MGKHLTVEKLLSCLLGQLRDRIGSSAERHTRPGSGCPTGLYKKSLEIILKTVRLYAIYSFHNYIVLIQNIPLTISFPLSKKNQKSQFYQRTIARSIYFAVSQTSAFFSVFMFCTYFANVGNILLLW